MIAKFVKALVLTVLTFVLFVMLPLRHIPYMICHYRLTQALGLSFNTKLLDGCGMVNTPAIQGLVMNLIVAPFVAWCVWTVARAITASLKAR